MIEMLGMSRFKWDDEKKLLQVGESVYDKWVKVIFNIYSLSFSYKMFYKFNIMCTFLFIYLFIFGVAIES